MNDLENIKQIEKILKINFEDFNVLMSCSLPETERWNSPRYTLNANGQLIQLKLDSCSIKDLDLELIIHPLKELENLKELDLFNNEIIDISLLKGLHSLEELILTNNKISDIPNMNELKRLSELFLSNNNISDISPLKGLEGLSVLNLNNNKIRDISILKELNSITLLYLSSNQISDISPLITLKSSKSIDLSNNLIRDLSPLIELKSLVRLDISNNQINDNYPLAELRSLTELNSDNNKISDISILKELKGLTKLHLSNNQINNISPLIELKSLTELTLDNNKISDISILKELKGLTKLHLSNNQISDFSSLNELKSLTELTLDNNKISDISILKELKGLTKLHLSNNQISDFSSLNELKSLTELNLNNNKISDISFLKELKGLRDLNLDNNDISDLSSLRELKSIMRLHLSNNKIYNIYSLEELKLLLILDLRNNPIEKLPYWITQFHMDIQWEDDFNLCSISCYNNPLKNPPVEIVIKGKEDIEAYFEKEKVLQERALNRCANPFYDFITIFRDQDFCFPKIFSPTIEPILYHELIKDSIIPEKPIPPKKKSSLLKLFGKPDTYQREIESYKKSLDYYENYLVESKRKEEFIKNLKKYPNLPIPLGRIILNKIISYSTEATYDSESAKGVAENSFYKTLRYFFGDYIFRNKSFTNPRNKNPFVPDFIFYDPNSKLKIDIEVDEPYVLNTGEPIHFDFCEKYSKSIIDRKYKSIDAYRNSLFQRHGWFVIRFTEEQVFNQSEACCKFLSQIIFLITGDYNFSQSNIEDELPILFPSWDIKQCLEYEKKGIREEYLGIPQKNRSYQPSLEILEMLKLFD